MKRAGFYIDGFNFYHAVAAARKPKLKWMSYRDLCSKLIQRNEEIAYVKVVTALATHIPLSMVRHRVLLKAWQNEGCEIVLGQFKRKFVHCRTCRQSTEHFEEKESDVNIAIHLLEDCRSGLCDVAYVVSTDSDIAPALRMVKKVYPHIELVTVAPPGRKPSWEHQAAGARPINASWHQVETSPLPKQVLDRNGAIVCERPCEYD